MSNLQVISFNGQRVRSLAALAAAVGACTDRFYRWELDSGEAVVIDASEAQRAMPQIMDTHSVPAVASPELLPLLLVGKHGEGVF